jgi:CRISPR-associated protein Cmr1
MRPTPPVPPSITELPALETRSYRLITPLFGGGVDAGIPDERQAINAKSIRGQLRFWWRATRAAQFKTVEEMKAFEDYLWGCAASDRKKEDTANTRMAQSRVQVTVIECNPQKSQVVFDGFRAADGIPAYAAFPLQENKRQNKPAGSVLKKGTTFSVQLQYPDRQWQGRTLALEVNAALWAWETFGGVGARTRRGFGAIERTENTVHDWQKHVQEGFVQHVIDGEAPTGVSRLSKRYEILPIGWKLLIDRFQRFRQGKGFARRPQSSRNPNSPGRTYWPEADSVRLETRQHLNSRAATHAPEHRVRKFPRGLLGLPIIFQFKDSDKQNPSNPNADPRETTLLPKGYERLASPLVLRPLSENHSIAVILETRGKPSEYLLNKHPVTLEVTADEAKLIRPLNGQPDVLQAALEHLKEQA